MLAALALAAAPAAAAERRYTVTDFDRVTVEGPYEVVLTTGKANSAVAKGSVEAIEGVDIDVEGRMLRIRPSRSGWGGYPGDSPGALKIELGTHQLRGLSVSGSGSIAADKARSARFDASVAGSGRIEVAQVEADKVLLGLMGSGKLSIGGKTKQLRATIMGGGDFDGAALTAEDADIKGDTAGTIAVGVKRTAKITATGAGDIDIIGAPACTVEAKGTGRIRCGK